MQILLVLVHVLTCIALIALVLLQQGKGAEIGAAFGSGASNTIFGSPGASSFLFKLTAGLAALFFITSLVLGFYEGHTAKTSQQIVIPQSIIQQQAAKAAAAQPPVAPTATPVIPVSGVDTAPTSSAPAAPAQQ